MIWSVLATLETPSAYIADSQRRQFLRCSDRGLAVTATAGSMQWYTTLVGDSAYVEPSCRIPQKAWLEEVDMIVMMRL